MNKTIFVGLSLLTTTAFALQTKVVSDNQMVTATVSEKDKTRIFVSGDRISSIHGTPNAYVYKNDDVNGQVYLMPTVAYQKQPFSLFITTENGKNYSLKLNPVDQAADSIMLKPNIDHSEAKHWESASGYNQAVVELIRYMVNGVSPEGYGVNQSNNAKPFFLGSIATLNLKTTYNGVYFKGEIYELHNLTNKPITVTETEFYRPETRAITLEQHTIPPHGTTTLYGVMSNG